MWEYYSPVRIFFGEGQLETLPERLEQNNIRRIALFLSGSFAGSQRAKALVKALGKKTALIIDGISPDPDVCDINKIADRMRAFDICGVVAIGGGSVIDSAKAASAAYANSCSIEELLTRKKPILKSLPLIAVPTTSGAGSEVTRAAALVYKGEKAPVFDDKIFAAVAIIDPELTISCPPAVTAVCGMDVLSHALEVLMHKNENAIATTLAMDAISLALNNLEICYNVPDNIAARAAMAEASLKAGMAITLAGCTASHACSYALTTEYHIPHGEACAFTLDHILRFCSKYDGRMDAYAARLGFGSANALADRIWEMKNNMNLRVRLGQIGAGSADALALAKAAIDSAVIKNHYFDIKYEDILEIFKNCL